MPQREVMPVKVTVECAVCNKTFETDDSLLLPAHPDQNRTNIICIGSNHKGQPVEVVPNS